MTELKVKDLGGDTIRCVDVGDNYITPIVMKTATEIKAVFDKVPDLPLRDDDVMLCSFAKTGTNWLYEVIKMILNKSAKRIESSKLVTMIEVMTVEEMEEVPSPRVMNTHLKVRYLPKDLSKKKTKTVLVLRNPKDSAVSYFNHMKGLGFYQYDGQWKNWLPLWMEGKLEYLKYSEYLKEWEQAIAEGVGFPLHVMFFEDLKQNFRYEIGRLAEFLDVTLDEETMSNIADTCHFKKMSKDKMFEEGVRESFVPGFNFFRKGEIGDWKNWFTVDQNEKFDKYWEEEMKDSKFIFKYTGKDE